MKVIQSNEYYAHSMPIANSWTRDNNTNNFLGNGGTEINTTTGIYDLQYRNFDPVLGRFHQVDPMVDRFSSHSPYNFAFNNPVLLNDPLGDYPPGVTFEYVVYTNWDGGVYRDKASPGSGQYWADGNRYSDWTPNGGSQMYRDGLAAGLKEFGGILYQIGPNGERTEVKEQNGGLVSWQGYNYTQWNYFFDAAGNLRRAGTAVVSGRYVSVSSSGNDNGFFSWFPIIGNDNFWKTDMGKDLYPYAFWKNDPSVKGHGDAFEGGSRTGTPGEDAFGNKRIIDRMVDGLGKVIDWFNPSKASGQDINDLFKNKSEKSGVYECKQCGEYFYDSANVAIPTIGPATIDPKYHNPLRVNQGSH